MRRPARRAGSPAPPARRASRPDGDPVAVGECEGGDVEGIAERMLGDVRAGVAVHAAAGIGGDLLDLDHRLAEPARRSRLHMLADEAIERRYQGAGERRRGRQGRRRGGEHGGRRPADRYGLDGCHVATVARGSHDPGWSERKRRAGGSRRIGRRGVNWIGRGRQGSPLDRAGRPRRLIGEAGHRGFAEGRDAEADSPRRRRRDRRST